MTLAPLPRDGEELLLLMAAVDTAFAEGDFALGEELDSRLEQRLDDLDHRLTGLDEGGDVLDGDDQVGVALAADLWNERQALILGTR